MRKLVQLQFGPHAGLIEVAATGMMISYVQASNPRIMLCSKDIGDCRAGLAGHRPRAV